MTDTPDNAPEYTLPTVNLDELRQLAVKQAMLQNGGRIIHAAKALGIGRASLYRWIAEGRVKL